MLFLPITSRPGLEKPGQKGFLLVIELYVIYSLWSIVVKEPQDEAAKRA